MHHRWMAVSLAAAVLVGCSEDPTGPQNAAVPLTLPQYALQLRGDPFISSVAGMLGHPELANRIDAAVVALNYGPHGITPLLASAHASLVAALSEGTETPVSETDVLSAVVTLTLDRIAQIDSASTAPASDPPSP